MKKPKVRLTSLVLGALAVCALSVPARAQEPAPTTPPPAAPPPASGTTFGGGAIGIGATTSFAPDAPGVDALFVYDQPVFHIDAALGYFHASHFNSTADSNFRFGVGGWYHLARGAMADFSLGGSVGLLYVSGSGANPTYTAFALEPGAEARVFLSPNFALMGRVGLLIAFGDNNHDSDFGIGGQTIADFGFTYFFR